MIPQNVMSCTSAEAKVSHFVLIGRTMEVDGELSGRRICSTPEKRKWLLATLEGAFQLLMSNLIRDSAQERRYRVCLLIQYWDFMRAANNFPILHITPQGETPVSDGKELPIYIRLVPDQGEQVTVFQAFGREVCMGFALYHPADLWSSKDAFVYKALRQLFRNMVCTGSPEWQFHKPVAMVPVKILSLASDILDAMWDRPTYGKLRSNILQDAAVVAKLPYDHESQQCRGCIVFAATNNDITPKTKFLYKTPTSEAQALRKLVAMSSMEAPIIASYDEDAMGFLVTGIGVAEGTTGAGILVRFVRHDVFEVSCITQLSHNLSQSVFTTKFWVKHGQVELPRPRYSKEVFSKEVDGVFGSSFDSELLWSYVEVAMKQAHGTMVVVSDDAKAESERLALTHRAHAIEPKQLTPDMLACFTNIDGALLVDPKGTVYAFGVILDGIAHASGEGNAARGARYNSAVCYTHYFGNMMGHKVLSFVVSEDGMVDCVKPRPLP